MQDQPKAQRTTADENLAKIGWALHSLRPAYLWVLHRVPAFVMLELDDIYEAMLPCQRCLRKVRRAMDRILTRVLCIPRNEPRLTHVAKAMPAAETVRDYGESCRVLLVADGTMESAPEGDNLGWGSLVADDRVS